MAVAEVDRVIAHRLALEVAGDRPRLEAVLVEGLQAGTQVGVVLCRAPYVQVLTGAGEDGVGDPDRAQPVGQSRQPVRRFPGHRRVHVGDKGIETVLVALRVAAGQVGQAFLVGGKPTGSAGDHLRAVRGAKPGGLRGLLVEDGRSGGAVQLEPEPAAPPGGHLRDNHAARYTGSGPERDSRDDLRRHRRERRGEIGWGDPRGEAALRAGRPLRHDDRSQSRQPRQPLTGGEFHQVAPVRADVGEGARAPTGLGVHTPVSRTGCQHPVLQVASVQGVPHAELPGGPACAQFLHDRVVAVDERYRRDQSGPGGQRLQLLRLRGRDRDRLLAHHMPARLQHGREPSTPTTSPPAALTARWCTDAIIPVPMIAARR
jgi:hypothetical protein